MTRIKIGVSACLLGKKVRYDSKDKYSDLIKYFPEKLYQLMPICPEVEMGLSVPRPAIQMRIIDKKHRLVQVNDHSIDYTDRFEQWFVNNQINFKNLNGYVLKSKSPSCGFQSTPYYLDNEIKFHADGLFVNMLNKSGDNKAIIDENSIKKIHLLKAFKQSLESIPKAQP